MSFRRSQMSGHRFSGPYSGHASLSDIMSGAEVSLEEKQLAKTAA